MSIRASADPSLLDPSASVGAGGRAWARLRTLAVFLWKYVLGTLFCLNPLLSFLVVGWTYRAARRALFRQWWKARPPGLRPVDYRTLAAEDASRDLLRWPDWILGPERSGGFAGARHRFLGSLWLNFKTGVQGLVNTWVITLPGCLLWHFAWFAGWNNSFYKGYELASFGPLTGLLGVALFLIAMLYLPMAQARQAATGNWKTFYHLRLLWRLVRVRWFSHLGLALLYAAVSLPVTFLLTLPVFLPRINPGLAGLSGNQAVEFLGKYYFVVAMVGFPAYLLLRLVAVRVYGRAVLGALAGGSVDPAELHEWEQRALLRLGLSDSGGREERHGLAGAAIRWGPRSGRAAALVLSLSLWFAFVAQIFISQFFFFRPVTGWLNQPLVQLPYFRYLPPDPGREEGKAGRIAE